MVDMPSLYSPLSPLGDTMLDSPLCGELIGDIQDLEEISQSLSEDTLSSLHMLDFQSSDTALDNSTGLGRSHDDACCPKQSGAIYCKLDPEVTFIAEYKQTHSIYCGKYPLL